ncbi:MAG: cob(I)yrinic acid a,c-diamide adenosyltransferase [Bacteroidales bacterium]|nr:cob(I)yrinic acid a,c-diamide adenosyltransferase [Bacteroidales bacterium]
MKIYTKKGDKCNTTLIGGVGVSKIHPRIEAYGTVDELIAHVGLLRDMATDNEIKDALLYLQDKLMVAAAQLAYDKSVKLNIPEILSKDVEWLEHAIDNMEASLTPLNNFLLPGGSWAVSQAHVCRTVCRRAERRIVELNQSFQVDEEILKFFNRLSDYFFVLSRFIAKKTNINEVHWKPKID